MTKENILMIIPNNDRDEIILTNFLLKKSYIASVKSSTFLSNLER